MANLLGFPVSVAATPFASVPSPMVPFSGVGPWLGTLANVCVKTTGRCVGTPPITVFCITVDTVGTWVTSGEAPAGAPPPTPPAGALGAAGAGTAGTGTAGTAGTGTAGTAGTGTAGGAARISRMDGGLRGGVCGEDSSGCEKRD